MKKKEKRYAAIERFIRNNSISNQSELLELLLSEGFQATQATLSRDMKQLQIVKFPNEKGEYIYKYPEKKNIETEIDEEGKNRFPLNDFIYMNFSGNLAVLKTRPGYAMAIASDIDNRIRHEIIGTVAGDDTILLIPREGIEREEIIKALSGLFPNLKSD